MANPTAVFLAAEMMLDHIGEPAAADAVRHALIDTFKEGRFLTKDVGGTSSTSEFSEWVAEKAAAHVASDT